MLHAEITALGYRGSLRTVYRYLQPLRAGTAGALPPLKVGEVTSWLLRPASDLDPRDQEVLTEIRAHCAQLDRLAGHVTSFATMMTRRTGERDLASTSFVCASSITPLKRITEFAPEPIMLASDSEEADHQ